MNDQILNSLVESYKEKGISTHQLMADPLFLSLPLERQVEAIQAYAGVLAQGSKIPPQGRVLGKAILSGVTAGVIAGLPFSLGFKNPRTVLATGIGSGLMGGVLGAASGLLMHRAEKKRFETTNKYLIQLSRKPDVATSVKVLDTNRKYEPRTLSSIVKKLASPEHALIDKAMGLAGKANEKTFKELDKTP